MTAIEIKKRSKPFFILIQLVKIKDYNNADTDNCHFIKSLQNRIIQNSYAECVRRSIWRAGPLLHQQKRLPT